MTITEITIDGVDYILLPKVGPAGTDTPPVIAGISKEQILQAITSFQEQTIMKGKFAVPSKNYEHLANYIIKQIEKHQKGGNNP